MKLLLEIFERSKHLFEKGGKLEKLYPLYEAKDTFLFTPSDVTASGAHVRDKIDMKRMMITVVIALIPCILYGMYNAGHQHLLVNGQGYFPIIDTLPNCFRELAQGALIVLPIIITSYAVGGIWEVVFAIIRKHEINEGFLVTGMLFALVLPPTIPLWQVAVGVSFGVVVGKEVFGGTGMNFLNPALTARAFLFFAYPMSLTGDTVWTSVIKKDVQVFGHTVINASSHIVSGFTGQTPLAVLADKDLTVAGATIAESTQNAINALHGAPFAVEGFHSNFTFWNMFIGNMGGSIGETSTLMCLIGAIILITTGLASWRIMLSMVIGLLGAAFVFKLVLCALAQYGYLSPHAIKPYYLIPCYYHLVMGGFAFGCVYMATDPVSAAVTNKGKWIYGLIIGVIVYITRVINPAYPEGVMLAILFGNMAAPIIDHLVVNKNIQRRLARGRK